MNSIKTLVQTSVAVAVSLSLQIAAANAEDAAPVAADNAAAPAPTAADAATAPKPLIGELMNAIRQNACKRAEEILKGGFNPNQYDAFGYTPLTVAALDKRMECVHVLLEAGADVNIASAAGWTPLIGAAMSGASGQLMAMLIGKGADVNAQNQWGCTALYYAAGFGAVPSVDFLLVNGAKYPGTGTECPTPMKIAVLNEYPEVIARLKKEEEALAQKAAQAAPAAAKP